MIVGIHKDPFGKFCPFLMVYEKILEFNGIKSIRLEASDEGFWDAVKRLDLFIFRWRQFDDQHYKAKSIINIAENILNIRCFPNMATCWHYDDKIRQYYLLKQLGVPVVETTVIWDKRLAIEWLRDNNDFPVVFKLKGGAGSSNVVLVKTGRHARVLARRMFGRGMRSGMVPGYFSTTRFTDYNPLKTLRHWAGDIVRAVKGESTAPWAIEKGYVLFQKYLPDNEYDTRVTVIGRRAFAFRRFNRQNDFRASGSGRIDYTQEKVDMEAVRLALNVSQKMGFQSMAYDILYDKDGKPKIVEISYTFVAEAVARCPGYWDSDLNWHPGSYWPQYFQLMDALNLPGLKQPELRVG